MTWPSRTRGGHCPYDKWRKNLPLIRLPEGVLQDFFAFVLSRVFSSYSSYVNELATTIKGMGERRKSMESAPFKVVDFFCIVMGDGYETKWQKTLYFIMYSRKSPFPFEESHITLPFIT